MIAEARLASSFRDPSGFVFRADDQLFRQVNRVYREDYDHLMGSGLCRSLVEGGLLVAHEEVDREPACPPIAYKVLRPQPVPFISYPYEWSFSQLKDAALLTLAIQRRALDFGMTLKDSSAFNIQFLDGRPTFIDTLSFRAYRPGEPWVAYRQFCQHFLAPLALMSRTDVRLNQLFRTNLDGIPLDLASALLPRRSWLRPSLLLHLHLHAGMQRSHAGRSTKPRRVSVSRGAMLGLIDHLEGAIRGLRWRPSGTEWADYYSETNYTPAGLEHKARRVAEFLALASPTTVWDLGANTGRFSRLASRAGCQTIAFDVDPACVERNYLEARAGGDARILPLWLDLLNPTPALGWQNRERLSILERGPADVVLALALIHHLAIAGNIPLDAIAEFLHRVGRRLIIEFVPRDDSQVDRLLVVREDIFGAYDREHFERGFGRYFTIERAEPIVDSARTLYLMRSKDLQ